MAPTTKPAPTEAPTPETEHDFTFTTGAVDLLFQAVQLGKASALEQSAAAAREIENPSLFNPQPDLWAARKAAADIAVLAYADLAKQLGEAIGLEPDPVVIVWSGVEGPGELNRPPSANPGSTNSNQV